MAGALQSGRGAADLKAALTGVQEAAAELSSRDDGQPDTASAVRKVVQAAEALGRVAQNASGACIQNESSSIWHIAGQLWVSEPAEHRLRSSQPAPWPSICSQCTEPTQHHHLHYDNDQCQRACLLIDLCLAECMGSRRCR